MRACVSVCVCVHVQAVEDDGTRDDLVQGLLAIIFFKIKTFFF